MCIYLHFRGFCHVTEATFISVRFQNMTYSERSTVLPLLLPEVLFKSLLLKKIFLHGTASSLLKLLYCSVFPTQEGKLP